MLTLIIPALESYDEIKGEFINTKGQTIQIEHSLVSISKWESKWHKPFLNKDPKTIMETLDYIRCMSITQNLGTELYNNITNENINQVSAYIDAPMTATWFSESKDRKSKEIITSEIIYYWMITYNIPSEYQKWHLNRLLTLIRVCDKKNAPNKQMSDSEVRARNSRLNAERRQKSNTKG